MSCSLREMVSRRGARELSVFAWHGKEDTTIEAKFAEHTYTQLAQQPGVSVKLEVEADMDHFVLRSMRVPLSLRCNGGCY